MREANGQFAAGHDPERFVLPQGNTFASAKNTPKLSRFASPEWIPAEFQVIVSPDEETGSLLDKLAVVADFAESMHDKVAALALPATGRTVGRYATTLRKMEHLAAQATASTLRPARYGNLSEKAAQAMKSRYARVLAGNLTKLRYGADWIERNGESSLVRADGSRLNYWAEFDQLREVVVGSMHIIQGWLELLAWERTKTKSDPTIDALYRVVEIEQTG